MAPRSLRSRLLDMERACIYLADRRAHPDVFDINADEATWWAIERAFEILSEASRHLPLELKSRYPTLNWRGIADIGNVLRHAYDGVNRFQLWDIMAVDIPMLRSVVLKELERLSKESPSP